ncbi:PAS domain S-box protein [sulfur-oxidizing endosymbiont of Gigantopelta aegis]|uniref:PAS domain S-box protein n=1 Tax=sulfur-oxidizing endosymbiont of Gigantopelta aegis TaxID=2794934 RepID=UPI0018DAFC4A|nr:PAS domain S-box protein [sulfur-oxidizing endosymbiont of Gigantopelta aegis]
MKKVIPAPLTKRSSLAKRLIIYMILFSASITLLTTAVQLYDEYQRDISSIEAQFEQVEKVHLRSITQSLWATNEQELRIQMEGLVKRPNVIYASVKNKEQVIAESGNINSENIIKRQFPMKHLFLDVQHNIGTLTIVSTLDNIYAELIREAITIFISNALRTLLVVIFVYFIFHHLISRHISRISQHFQQLALNQNSLLALDRKPPQSPDELDLLVDSVNKMQARLNTTLQAFTESKKKYRTLTTVAPVGIFYTDTQGNCLFVNKKWSEISGMSAKEAKGQGWIKGLHPDDKQRIFSSWDAFSKNNANFKLEYRFKHGDSVRWVLGQATAEKSNDGKILGYVGTITDITEKVTMEESLRRSQKMDALGKLTGGIAHDYNNMLGVVLGYTDLLYDSLSEHPRLQNYVEKIKHAGQRGAKLTKKLLLFSRRQSADVETININDLLQEEKHMLEKTLTSRIQLHFELEENLWGVHLDVSELEDAILNMCINAMHAINKNGQLIIRTKNRQFNAQDAIEFALPVGDYVQLNIEDTGCGMDKHCMEQIFDPFYSTKGDKGTGLGLSQVYGFMKRCSGDIKVNSQIHQGTQFSLFFPRHHGQDNQHKDITTPVVDWSGNENILLVDDEPALLDLNCEILSKQGYHPFSAENASQALEILKTEAIVVMVSDVVMPKVDGYELANIAHEHYPDLKIQLVSGYSSDKYALEGNSSEFNKQLSQELLQKPYSADALLEKIRTLLDG